MNPLEERVAKLERKLEAYERIFSVTASQLIIHKPIVVKGTIGVGGPAGDSSNPGAMIFAGNFDPDSVQLPAPQGSIFLRTNGAGSSTLYWCYNGTRWGDAPL